MTAVIARFLWPLCKEVIIARAERTYLKGQRQSYSPFAVGGLTSSVNNKNLHGETVAAVLSAGFRLCYWEPLFLKRFATVNLLSSFFFTRYVHLLGPPKLRHLSYLLFRSERKGRSKVGFLERDFAYHAYWPFRQYKPKWVSFSTEGAVAQICDNFCQNLLIFWRVIWRYYFHKNRTAPRGSSTKDRAINVTLCQRTECSCSCSASESCLWKSTDR